MLVLFEQKKGVYWVGHTDNYVTIKAQSSNYLRSQIVSVRITGIDAGMAKGEII